MSNRVNPDLLTQIEQYGETKIEMCFNCGNCTAICPLTSEAHPFPRNMIRLAQLGLEDQLLASSDPWLCYYCGECTETCPRGAEPAEAMMTLRRWLTARYAPTEHSARLYTSEKAVWISIFRIALVTLAAFVVFHLVSHDRIVTDRVELNTFAPVMLVWGLVLLHGARLAYRMFAGVRNMFRHMMKDTNIPFSVYVEEFKTFVIHFFTQKRWRDCGMDNHSRWLKHLLLVSGYLTMLTLIIGLLWWFQTDEVYPIYHPQRWLGYYATIVLIYGSVDMLIGRYRKREQIHRFSQPTDWFFPAFILVGSITGILVHIFRYLELPYPTYGMYVFHVMAMMAMLDTEVGIGKWAHLAYRPFALYLDRVKQRVKEDQAALGLATAGSD